MQYKYLLVVQNDELKQPSGANDIYTDVAEMSLSRCVKTNEGERTATMDKVRPSSEAFQVTYDYEFLQEVNSDSLR